MINSFYLSTHNKNFLRLSITLKISRIGKIIYKNVMCKLNVYVPFFAFAFLEQLPSLSFCPTA